MRDKKLNFKAVVLDLFDTLVTWDPGKLPVMLWNGREIHSTIPWILPRLETALGTKYSLEAFVTSYTKVYEDINVERERDGIEITCHERFVRTLASLGVDAIEQQSLAEDLTRIHMKGVRDVTSTPARRIAAVNRLAQKYRLGLLSNFDDSKTGWEIIADTGVQDRFEAIIISADLAIRKPNPKIFQRMLEMLDLQPEEVLFVGDTPHHDVVGAKSVGMSAAWIHRPTTNVKQGASAEADLSIFEGLAKPDYVIEDLADLPDILET
jgi:HAD superfamily hydrolase (TIGR01549 family)